MTNRKHSVNKLLKTIWIGFAIFIILAAVSSSIFRSLTPWAKQYKGEVEHHLSVLLGQPVSIQSMETGWYWFQPVLKLNHVIISDGQNKSIYLDKLIVGINLFKSLLHWQIQPGVLYIEDINLNLTQKDGQWAIDGISTSAINDNEMTPEKTLKIVSWLAQQERLILRNVSAHLHFSDGGLIPISGLNVSILNSGGHYKLKGNAVLDQTNSTSFSLLGDIYFDPYQLEDTSGQIYFLAKRVDPAQWQSILPRTSQSFEGGKGAIELWVDLKNGAISQIQSHVQFKRLAWHLLNTKRSQIIQSLSANLAWKPDAQGWQFLADHMFLRVGGYNWPENQLSIKFDKEQQSYQIFVKTLVLESLSTAALNWPQSMQSLININPQGVLTDTHVGFKDNELNVFLTRFDKLSWNAKDLLVQVNNLAGVLYWQPEEGRLELDSEHAAVTFSGYPTQNLTILNGAFDWKELGNGLRISMERFVLSQPELTFSAEGAADQVTKESLGHIRLAAQFSGKNMQQWISYIPQKLLKPKLYLWLTRDVKRIAESTGQIIVNGFAKDFPFDNNDGEFSIVSHSLGGEMRVSSKWPLIKDLEGYLRLNKRNLDIDVIHGDFQGVPVKQMNIRIDDIGHKKEVLLVHVIANGLLNKMQRFIMASPLQRKLTTLKMLGLEGYGLLNLHIQADLYPESDDVLVKGDLAFKNNTVLVHHAVGEIALENVTGGLDFDEKGVTQSALSATAFGYPLDIKIQSVKSASSYTTVLVNAECTIESLTKRFNLPIFAFMKGMFALEAQFKLTDDAEDFDSLNIVSRLRGLAINLPAPLGKIHNAEAPLEVNLDFNVKKAFRLKLTYDKRLSTDILFKQHKGAFDLDSGQIRIGSNLAVNQNKPGLEIVGLLSGFDFKEWNKVFDTISKEPGNTTLLHKIRIINLTFDKLTVLKQVLNQLVLKAKILPDNDWSFNLEHKNIVADLTYHPLTHSLSGYIKKLHLDSIQQTRFDPPESSIKYTPNQIPNLNLRVDNLSIGTIEVGDLTFKSKSTEKRWLIDYCRIESPIYQFNIQGEWTQKDKKDRTQLHVAGNLKNLAKALERWQISPALDAGKGEMVFKGGWNDAVYNFSLAALDGSMYLKLRNGIITHLSQETEEKLGLGKLLSILSLQTIPRRLKLDFSDLSHEGYSFDVFKGNFSINKGIMSTQDSYLDGPVAYASMKGNLDLVRKMYDLNLRISPHITASLPIVATIAGGPIAGIAAWVANKIINQSMQKISAYSYKVSGPWNQPVVQQLSIVRKITKKQ